MTERNFKVVQLDHEYICCINIHPDEGLEDCTGKPSLNGYRSWPVKQTKPRQNSIILDHPAPIYEVTHLKTPGAVEVYALLFESAYKDREWDKRKHLAWSVRSDFGGTTEWSVKGLASQLGIGKVKVRNAINALLLAGFITVISFINSGNGSKIKLFRVTHYSQLKSVQYSLGLVPELYGLTTKAFDRNEVKEDRFSVDVFTDEQVDWFDFLATDYDPGFNGLFEGHYISNFNERKEVYLASKTKLLAVALRTIQ